MNVVIKPANFNCSFALLNVSDYHAEEMQSFPQIWSPNDI